MHPHRALFALQALLLVLSFLECGEPANRRGTVDDERWLEGRLIAPCCWMQTLDVHESPPARELRAEIHERLAGGEAPGAIEDDLVSRYGEPIRALPKGKDPRHRIVLFVATLVLAAGAALARLARRRTNAVPVARLPVAAATRDALDDRLDEELRDLDG